MEESLAPIAKLQKQGKIRHIGLSEVKPHEIDRARKVINIVSVQNQYNLSDRQHEDVLEYCEKQYRVYPVVPGRIRRPGEAGRQAGRDRQASWSYRGAVFGGLAAAPQSCDAADSRHVKRSSPGRKHEGREISLSAAEMKAIEAAVAGKAAA